MAQQDGALFCRILVKQHDLSELGRHFPHSLRLDGAGRAEADPEEINDDPAGDRPVLKLWFQKPRRFGKGIPWLPEERGILDALGNAEATCFEKGRRHEPEIAVVADGSQPFRALLSGALLGGFHQQSAGAAPLLTCDDKQAGDHV